MKRIQLVFPNLADVWNFLVVTKLANVEVNGASVTGLFTQPQLDIACKTFKAQVQEVPLRAPNEGEEVELRGKSGTAYRGTLYSRAQHPASLPKRAIICLTNSAYSNDNWQHRLVDVYRTEGVANELKRFRERRDLSHVIVIPDNPGQKGPADKTDDLIRNYLHS